MSLKPEPIPSVPPETVRIAKAAFPKGSTFIKMREELGTLYTDELFATFFPRDGQPALARLSAGESRQHAICRGIV